MRHALIALALLCASCASSGPMPASSQVSLSQDGTSIQAAVVIEASSSSEGIGAEYAWLAKKHPGFKREKQSLLHHGSKAYDAIEITTSDGRRMIYYFDITSFFGKW